VSVPRLRNGWQRQHHEEPYQPPPSENVRVVALENLLQGVRPVPEIKQQSLQFTEESSCTKLWCAGDTSIVEKPCVAVVGTRKVSKEGAARARRLARELAESAVVVVSALAEGVDTEALTAAMAAGGRVIGVIGTPINKAYPAANKRLQEQIYTNHLLISQFEPGRPTFPSNFPERNKLMAILSDATVIIEASDTSGALHQADACMRLKRWLLIAQAIVDDRKLSWPSRFRDKPQVKVLTKTADVLNVLSL